MMVHMVERGEGQFHLGGIVEAGERVGSLLYESDHLTTHGVIVGMTGSGKTGLGIDVLEEALAAGVPALVIDPKGDMGNLKLLFPDFAADDFEPWVSADEAQREGVSVAELARSTADTWREGLAGWGIDGDDVRRLRDGSVVTIYTPGSSAGVPLNVVGSLDAPRDLADMESVRDEIEGFVTSLLALVAAGSPISERAASTPTPCRAVSTSCSPTWSSTPGRPGRTWIWQRSSAGSSTLRCASSACSTSTSSSRRRIALSSRCASTG